MEGDDKVKVVHRHLLLPLFSNPSDHTSELDTRSVVDQTVNTHANMGVYSRAWVSNSFP